MDDIFSFFAVWKFLESVLPFPLYKEGGNPIQPMKDDLEGERARSTRKVCNVLSWFRALEEQECRHLKSWSTLRQWPKTKRWLRSCFESEKSPQCKKFGAWGSSGGTCLSQKQTPRDCKTWNNALTACQTCGERVWCEDDQGNFYFSYRETFYLFF